MAKKSKDYNVDDDIYNDDDKGNPFVNIIIVIVVIVIWLAIFALLIKMDVGGIGGMLRPFLKDIPVINMILPDASDEEVMEETGFKYKNLAEAIERIKELEAEIATLQETNAASAETIAQLQAEIERLKVYEQNQLYYYELKEKFDREIVFNDKAPSIEEYKKWYEEISPDNAAEIYEEVIRQLAHSEEVKAWSETFVKMDPENAAAILEEMTGDTDLVAEILLCMTSAQRGAIMQEMDPVYAAKLTKIMYPGK